MQYSQVRGSGTISVFVGLITLVLSPRAVIGHVCYFNCTCVYLPMPYGNIAQQLFGTIMLHTARVAID